MLAGRYELLDLLGRGGMGTVWRARDQMLEREVAIKEVRIDPTLTKNEHDLLKARTKREARTTARLNNPSIITVYDVVEEDDKPWIVMELVQARSLEQVIREDGPLSWRQAAEIGRQLLDALNSAHQAGVLHRDVKPGNVLLDPAGRAILTDFGIATAVGEATLTNNGLILGSPAYVAPERAHGEPTEAASDLWSLGALLYAAVTGRSPFQRSEPLASLMAVVTDDASRPPAAGPLWPVIDGLLRKDPRARLDCDAAAAMIDEILALPQDHQAYEEDEKARSEKHTVRLPAAVPIPAGPPPPIAAHPPPSPPASDIYSPNQGPPSRRADKRKRWVPLVGLLAILLAAAMGYALFSYLAPASSSKGHSSAGRPTVGHSASVTSKASPTASATSSPPAGSAPSSPPGSPPSNAATAAPAGFSMHKDANGYTIAVPDGWSGPERKSGGDFYYSPDRSTYIQVDYAENPSPSALADWQNLEPSVRNQFPGYHRLRMEPVVHGDPISDPSGKKSADWEYTWDSGNGTRHVLSRGMILNGHGYALVVSSPESSWSHTWTSLAPVYQTFQPKP